MSKVSKILVGVILGVLLSAALFASGVGFGAGIQALEGNPGSFPILLPTSAPQTPSNEESATQFPDNELNDLFIPFWEAWDIIHEEFVDQPVDNSAIMQGAIQGMLEALGDPQSSYMDPDEYIQATTRLEGEYDGIGAWVDPDQDYLTIISPMPGSPAEQAGLRPGDQIVAIDGEDMTGIDGNAVIKLVLGPAGTTITLTIFREGEAGLFEVDVTREHIIIPSIESETLEDGIAYVRLYNFGDSTSSDLRSTLKDLLEQNPRGLILDLRGNGGGFLATSVEVASQFISQGAILIERFGDGREQVYNAQSGGLATTIPMVVLIDKGSASASEIVAGAIRDYKRGLLVGETSFGKGSVQNWIELSGENGAVRITIARWLTPNKHQIDGVGIAPDVEIEMTDEDRQNDLDPQLEGAIEALAGMLDNPSAQK